MEDLYCVGDGEMGKLGDYLVYLDDNDDVMWRKEYLWRQL
jgi:hypothetical protein